MLLQHLKMTVGTLLLGITFVSGGVLLASTHLLGLIKKDKTPAGYDRAWKYIKEDFLSLKAAVYGGN
jgi:hypothetical protein